MRLNELIDRSITLIQGKTDLEITGISSNSREIKPGNLFIAKKGLTHDGTKFIPDAIQNGASAILSEKFPEKYLNVTLLQADNIPELEIHIANKYYNFPSKELFVVGITGTNGKTTISYLVKHLLDNIEMPCGLIGTIGYTIGDKFYNSTMTTPDIITNQKILRSNINENYMAMAMEVSSHALDQNRVKGINYNAAIFSNFSQDHLDYHHTMENYFLAKAKLFSEYEIEVAIINADAANHEHLLNDSTITYGIKNSADIMATNIKLTNNKTSFEIDYNGEKVLFTTNLIGEFNVYNCLSVIALGITQNVALNKIAKILQTFPGVPGRLERIANNLNLNAYVDYAHTDDALTNVLKTISTIKANGRIITVFGCGGDRDKDKRPKMAHAAENFSDITIVTSDNPRSEDPMNICQEIASGFSHRAKYFVQVDRFDAIKQAIALATKEDIILIAGKGHETSQIFKENVIELDDRKIVKEICKT